MNSEVKLYDLHDCIFYLEEKIKTLRARASEFGFLDEQIKKEVNVDRSILDILQAVKELKTANTKEEEHIVELLKNQ